MLPSSALNCGLQSDVRKVGNRQHVDDPPAMVGKIATRLGADCATHLAACAIAADDVFGADRRLRAVSHIAQRGHDRVLTFGFDFQRYEFQVVVGLESRRRPAHVVEKVLLHARLVHDEVRELGQVVRGVLNAAGAHDPRSVLLRRTPERGLVDPVALANELLAHAERSEHFNRAAGYAVGLTQLKWTVAPLDEASTDGGKRRELSAEQRSSRPATDDQDVYRVGEACGSVLSRRRCRVDVGVTGPIAIEIELHACLPSEDHYFGGTIRCRCHLNANAEPSL